MSSEVLLYVPCSAQVIAVVTPKKSRPSASAIRPGLTRGRGIFARGYGLPHLEGKAEVFPRRGRHRSVRKCLQCRLPGRAGTASSRFVAAQASNLLPTSRFAAILRGVVHGL